MIPKASGSRESEGPQVSHSSRMQYCLTRKAWGNGGSLQGNAQTSKTDGLRASRRGVVAGQIEAKGLGFQGPFIFLLMKLNVKCLPSIICTVQHNIALLLSNCGRCVGEKLLYQGFRLIPFECNNINTCRDSRV